MRKRLSEEEMEILSQGALRVKSGDMPWETFLIKEFFEKTMGVDPEVETIDPTEFEIPEDQWMILCGKLNASLPIYDLDGAIRGTWNPAFAWMNSGPSGY